MMVDHPPPRPKSMKHPSDIAVSPLRTQAADALRRARKLPVGPDRNDLRQLAVGLRFLDKQRLKASVRDRAAALPEVNEPQRNSP
jgi:hypothetical protein